MRWENWKFCKQFHKMVMLQSRPIPGKQRTRRGINLAYILCFPGIKERHTISLSRPNLQSVSLNQVHHPLSLRIVYINIIGCTYHEIILVCIVGTHFASVRCITWPIRIWSYLNHRCMWNDEITHFLSYTLYYNIPASATCAFPGERFAQFSRGVHSSPEL